VCLRRVAAGKATALGHDKTNVNSTQAGPAAEKRVTMGQYYVYILASQRNGTLYIGMTNDLVRRIWQHKNDLVEGFTQKYGVHCLVWYEVADTPSAAITREKQLKKWNRAWKLRLIEETNPEWKDLYDEIAQ
jgi:putative endonuclease